MAEEVDAKGAKDAKVAKNTRTSSIQTSHHP